MPPVKNIIYGGQQEHGIRPGTLPVALIAGCGKACEIAEQEFKNNKKILSEIKNMILDEISKSGIDYKLNGHQEYCVDSTINICFSGVSSEALMLSAKQYCGVSNGSACTSKSYTPSYVLMAMGIPTDQIENSIRISWGPNVLVEEVREGIIHLLETAKQICG